nr:MAG: ORF1a [Astroviridae sp.]
MFCPWWRRKESLVLQLPLIYPPMEPVGEPQGADSSPAVLDLLDIDTSPSLPTRVESDYRDLQQRIKSLEKKLKEAQEKALDRVLPVPKKVTVGGSEEKVFLPNDLPITAAEKGKTALCEDGASADLFDTSKLLGNKVGGFAGRLRKDQDTTAGVAKRTSDSGTEFPGGARPKREHGTAQTGVGLQISVGDDLSKWPVSTGVLHKLADAMATVSLGKYDGTADLNLRKPVPIPGRTQRFLSILSGSRCTAVLGWVLLAVALVMGAVAGGMLVVATSRLGLFTSQLGGFTLEQLQTANSTCHANLSAASRRFVALSGEFNQCLHDVGALSENHTQLLQSHAVLQEILEQHKKHLPASDKLLLEARDEITKLQNEVSSLKSFLALYEAMDGALNILVPEHHWWHWLVWAGTCFLMWAVRPSFLTSIHMLSVFFTRGSLALCMWVHVLGGWSAFVVLPLIWWIPQFFCLMLFAACAAWQGRWFYLFANVILSAAFNAFTWYLRDWGVFVASGLIQASVMHMIVWLMPFLMKLGLWSQGDIITTHRWTGERVTTYAQNWLQRCLWKSHSDREPNPQRREVQKDAKADRKIRFVKGETIRPSFKPEADYGQPWVSDEVQAKITPLDVLNPQSKEIMGKAFHMNGLLATPFHVWESVGKTQTILVQNSLSEFTTKKVGDLKFSGETLVAFQPIKGHKSLVPSRMKGIVSSCIRTRNGTTTWGLTTGLTNTNAATHSCTTQAGDSGAPVCDQHGKLLGVHIGAAPGANLLAQKMQPESKLVVCADCECGCGNEDECRCNMDVGYAVQVPKPKLLTPEAALVKDPCVTQQCKGIEVCFDYGQLQPPSCKVPPGQVDLCFKCTEQATDNWQSQFSCSANRCNFADDPCVVCNCDAAFRDLMMTRPEIMAEYQSMIPEKGPAGAFKALKKKKSREQRMPKRMFTDEEYEELLAMGLSPSDIRKLARERFNFLMDRGHGSNLDADFDPNRHLVIGKHGLQTVYHESAESKNSQSSPGPAGRGSGGKNSKGSSRQIQKSDTNGDSQGSVPPTEEQPKKPPDNKETFSEIVFDAVLQQLEDDYANLPANTFGDCKSPDGKLVRQVALQLDHIAEMMRLAKIMKKKLQSGEIPGWDTRNPPGKDLKRLYKEMDKR